MTTYILFLVAKCVVVSLVMWIIFRLFVRNRASYSGQRIFLLSTPLVAIAFSLISLDTIALRFDRFTPVGDAIVSVSEVAQPLPESAVVALSEADIPAYTAPIEALPMPSESKTSLPYLQILIALWGVVALYFVANYVVGLSQIYRLRSRSSREFYGGVNIYSSSLVDGPFSFFRSIFINSSLSGEKYNMVMQHERAHIESYHFVDKLIVEIYRVALWFNPVVWLLYREIGKIHEFQADSVVLCGCSDVKQYKHFIFDEAVGATPTISNGFNNSLIKQRFLHMKENYQMKSSWFTKVVTTLAVALLFIGASCTFIERDTQVDISFSGTRAEADDATVEIKLNDGTTKSGPADQMSEWISENADKVESINIKKDAKAIRQKYQESIPPVITLEDDRYHIIAKRDFKPIAIYRRDGYTEVDMMYEVYSKWYWVYYTSNEILRDRESGEEYKIIGIAGDKPLNTRLAVRGKEDKYAMHTLIFPPIKEGVEAIDYVGGDLPDSLVKPTNTSPGRDYYPDVKVNGNIERPYLDERSGARIVISKSDLPKF